MADRCEAWVKGEWVVIDMRKALANPNLVKRCVECHGAVRIHKAGEGVSAHAEHKVGHKGCSFSQFYDGKQRKHPEPLKSGEKNANRTVHLNFDPIIPEEVTDADFYEGRTEKIFVNRYERDLNARKKCLNRFGYKCAVCDDLLENRYGKIARNIIHVHHVKPLSTVKKQYKVDPEKDLSPVCPNCHAVIHSRKEPYTIDEVRKALRRKL